MFCSQLAFSILETFWTSFGARFWITFGLIWASWGTLGTPSGPPRGLGRCSGHYPTPDCKTPCKTLGFGPPKMDKSAAPRTFPHPLPLTLPLLGAQGAWHQLQSRLKACFPSSMDPWMHGSMAPWIHGSIDPWIHRSMDP